MNDKELRNYIKNYLMNIGVPIHLVGYKYLTTAIAYCIENIDEDLSMGEIYEEINKKHKVKKERAERDIRYIMQTFKLNIESNKFTNKVFIYYVAQELYNNLFEFQKIAI